MSLTIPPSLKNKDFSGEISKNPWKLPILGSILIHVFMIGGSIFAPYLFQDKNIQKIHTVDLVNIEEPRPEKKQEPAAKSEAEKIKPSPPKKQPEPEPEKISTEITEKIAEQESQQPASKEVVSLKPRLTKKEINSPEKTRDRDKQIDTALARVKQEVQKKRRERKIRQAEENAREYARQAVKDLREMLQSENVASRESTEPRTEKSDTDSSSRESTRNVSREDSGKAGASPSKAVLKQYLSAIYRKIQVNWSLPEVTDWDNDLEAILAITVTRNGTVIRSKFEKTSSNIYFNRFVEKTLNKSSPLPPFPDNLKREQIEIGLIFHPEGLK